MRVSCAVPKAVASDGLVAAIEALGVQPIVTNIIIRAVYEGSDKSVGTAIVELFSKEKNHDVYVEPEKEKKAGIDVAERR